MKNLGQMMKQAAQMQAKMLEMQQRLSEKEVEGSAGGGLVKVMMNGKAEVLKVSLSKDVVDPNEIEVLEDLILAAFNDAKGKVETMMQDEMRSVTGGLNLPEGLKLPF